MKFTYYFILTINVYSQSVALKVSLNQLKISIFNHLEISNDSGQFYRRTSSTILENDVIAILDVGNDCILLYSLEGKFIKKFGEKGQGPGEFSNPDKIYSTPNSIIVRNNYKLNFFTYDGKLIKDVSLFYSGQVGHPLIVNKSVYVYFEGNSKLTHIEYDSKGNKINEYANKAYKRDGVKEDDTILLSNSIRIIANNKNIYQIPRGLFKINKFDHSFNKLKSFHLDLKAIKRNPKKLLENMVFDKRLKGESLKKAMQQELKLLLKKLSKYENGITSLIGFYKELLVIQVKADNEKDVKLLFINDKTIVANMIISNVNATEIRVFKNKLILNKKSDETGPQISIYKLLG